MGVQRTTVVVDDLGPLEGAGWIGTLGMAVFEVHDERQWTQLETQLIRLEGRTVRRGGYLLRQERLLFLYWPAGSPGEDRGVDPAQLQALLLEAEELQRLLQVSGEAASCLILGKGQVNPRGARCDTLPLALRLLSLARPGRLYLGEEVLTWLPREVRTRYGRRSRRLPGYAFIGRGTGPVKLAGGAGTHQRREIWWVLQTKARRLISWRAVLILLVAVAMYFLSPWLLGLDEHLATPLPDLSHGVPLGPL